MELEKYLNNFDMTELDLMLNNRLYCLVKFGRKRCSLQHAIFAHK